MRRAVHFYMDDSGTRSPNRKLARFDPRAIDHFALGGILVRESDEGPARAAYDEFCRRWEIGYALHSVDIRHRAKAFAWLGLSEDDYARFMRDLNRFLTSLPVVAIACVIDRPGYDARYGRQYGARRWGLCRTAFTIAVERAVKYALRLDSVLRVYPERSSKKDESKIKEYYEQLRTEGLPFDPTSSAGYRPLDALTFKSVLYDLKFKEKKSPMIQVADLLLWPIIYEKYRPGYRAYEELRRAGRLIECELDPAEVAERGSKYSCFELVEAALAKS